MTSLYTAQMTRRRGLTFWGQWLCALSLVNLLLMLLVYWRVGSLTSEYRVLMILTVLGSCRFITSVTSGCQGSHGCWRPG
jgi:putative colanic acid biosynthesis UDP-glucose lipid carrier transferase